MTASNKNSIVSSVVSMYRLGYAKNLVLLLQQQNYKVWRYLSAYWQTQDFSKVAPGEELHSSQARNLAGVLGAGMGLQIVAGIVLIVLGVRGSLTAGVAFGAAVIISYPVVWAHMLALGVFAQKVGRYAANPKSLGREIVCAVLESQVHQLRNRHKFTVVAVAGSVGKTSTKLAIADLLAQTKRVRHQLGNYNDRVTVPLVLFGQTEPSILNVFAWLKIFISNAWALGREFAYDVVVVELGSDGPRQLEKFAYLAPEIAVVTAVTPEHMEYFKTLDAVAAEELAVFEFSKCVLVNTDDIAAKYLADRTFEAYSLTDRQAEYHAAATPKDLYGQHLELTMPKGKIEAEVQYIGRQGAKFALAAAAVADVLGVKHDDIAKGLTHLQHFAGRMQVLSGVKNSTLIDDTYNASPVAVMAALDVLYGAKAPQRIALLGNMNELGEHSAAAHKEVGDYCDAKKLDLVLTLGEDANKYLALAAKAKGCTVKTCKSPYEAGKYIEEHMAEGAAVLAKGSQNGVFAEEALKPLLADKTDEAKLVRQSAYWLKRKQQQFPR